MVSCNDVPLISAGNTADDADHSGNPAFYPQTPDVNPAAAAAAAAESNKSSTTTPNGRQNHPYSYNKLKHGVADSSGGVDGSWNDDTCEPLVVYSRRQTVEKTKNKGKAVTVPFTSPPLEKTKDKWKVDSVSFSCSPLEKTKDKGKAVPVPFNSPYVEKTKNKGKAIGVTFSSPVLMTKDKGKTVSVPFGRASLDKTKDKGKAIVVPLSFPSTEKTKNRGKVVSVPLSCPPLSKTRNIRNKLEAGDTGLSKSCTDPHMQPKKKRHCLPPEEDVSRHALPKDFVEQQRAYFNEVDEFELLEEEISDDESI